METEKINIKIKMLDNSINEIDVAPQSKVSDLKIEIEKAKKLINSDFEYTK